MKVSIIGAGNVGGLTAMRLLEAGVDDLVLVDVLSGLAEGKALDLEDALAVLKYNYAVKGSGDIAKIKDSGVVVITAGLARKPGMAREDLIQKNGRILKEICLDIKTLAPNAILIIVTNPLDLLTRLALQVTGFNPKKVFGMGITLDAARFSNLIAKELNISTADIEACVVGSHGEGMLPLPRFTTVKGVTLDTLIDRAAIEELVKKTILRGAAVVSLLGSGSAYFAPSSAIAALVKAILKDEKRILGVSAYLNGEYGLKDVCIGVPCRVGKNGIENIVELELNAREKELFLKSAAALKEEYSKLAI